MTAVAVPRSEERVRRLGATVSLAAANAVDVWTTGGLLDAGGTEMNPTAGWLLEHGALAPAKFALVLLIGVLAWRVPVERRWVSRALTAVAAAYVVVCVWNGIQLALAG